MISWEPFLFSSSSNDLDEVTIIFVGLCQAGGMRGKQSEVSDVMAMKCKPSLFSWALSPKLHFSTISSIFYRFLWLPLLKCEKQGTCYLCFLLTKGMKFLPSFKKNEFNRRWRNYYRALKVEPYITWGTFKLISDLWLRLQNKYWMHSFRTITST